LRRRQFVEIEDLDWCPRAVRDGGTDWLAFMANASGMFAGVAPKIRAAMNAVGTTTVLDLGSGGGGAWLTLERELARSGPVTVVLSDLYPNLAALGHARSRSGGRLQVHETAVDATNVPTHLRGVRTIFNAFHHFPPDTARRILADAVAKDCPIAIFEGAGRRAIGLVAMPLQLPLLLLFTPFIRPFRSSRLALTYLVPLIPLLVLFDGTMSFLRLYLEDELRELVASTPGHERFVWDVGTMKRGGVRAGPMYFVGVPRQMVREETS
jgi:hypothetical protein